MVSGVTRELAPGTSRASVDLQPRRRANVLGVCLGLEFVPNRRNNKEVVDCGEVTEIVNVQAAFMDFAENAMP